MLLQEDEFLSDFLHRDVKTKKFENTSSTKLELETLLWALSEITPIISEIIIYTDCQNIIGLKDRREGFEKNNYMSKSNKQIKNRELYIEFYKLTDLLRCEFVKVKGHKRNSIKSSIDNIFTLVDKASRVALRDYFNTTAHM